MQDITTLTYTVTLTGDTTPTVITPQVKTRNRDGKTMTVITGLAPLLAEHIDAIADEASRMHALNLLQSARIVIRDTPDDTIADGPMSGCDYRDRGTLGTTYVGFRDLTSSTVLDLAEQLRAQLGL